MAKFEKGNKRGNRFSSENQPTKRGRGREPMRKYVERITGAKIGDIKLKELTEIMTFLATASQTELEPLLTDPNDPNKPNPNTPIWIVNMIAALNRDSARGRIDTLERILDRVYGKALQPIEGDINAQVTNKVDLSMLSTDELIQYNQLLDKIKAGNNGTE